MVWRELTCPQSRIRERIRIVVAKPALNVRAVVRLPDRCRDGVHHRLPRDGARVFLRNFGRRIRVLGSTQTLADLAYLVLVRDLEMREHGRAQAVESRSALPALTRQGLPERARGEVVRVEQQDR